MSQNKLAAFSDMFLCLQNKHYEKSENMEQLTNTTCSMSYIDSMEGHEFERFIAALLCRLGYQKVEVTRGSGDQGVDILAEKDDIRYAIQCKCYSTDLGNSPIQEVNTGKAIYHCHVGVVVTNRYFTKGAKDAAIATGVILWDRTKLQAMITQVVSGLESSLGYSNVTLKGVSWNETNRLFNQVISPYLKGDDICESEQQYSICTLAEKRKALASVSTLISVSSFYTVALRADGTIVTTGLNECGRCDVKDWVNIVAIVVGDCHTIGLRNDGTVMATGANFNGECNITSWTDIVAIAAGNDHTVGLRSDGTVVRESA